MTYRTYGTTSKTKTTFPDDKNSLVMREFFYSQFTIRGAEKVHREDNHNKIVEIQEPVPPKSPCL